MGRTGVYKRALALLKALGKVQLLAIEYTYVQGESDNINIL